MPRNYQTIQLDAGRHPGPEDGACVMELASMLAHEPFSDRPESVCPVIAAFLRSYNDRVDQRRRQDLFRYAARAIGTRADGATERERAQTCLRWARRCCDQPPLKVRILHRMFRCQGPEVDGVYAARAAVATENDDLAHDRVLSFLDGLLSLGTNHENLGSTARSEPNLTEHSAAG